MYQGVTIRKQIQSLPLQNPTEHIKGPEVTMQNDLVPELPPSGGYENIMAAMDVF